MFVSNGSIRFEALGNGRAIDLSRRVADAGDLLAECAAVEAEARLLARLVELPATELASVHGMGARVVELIESHDGDAVPPVEPAA